MNRLKSLLRGREAPPQEDGPPPPPLYTADYVAEYAQRYHEHMTQQNAPRKFSPLLMETRCYAMLEENGVKVRKEAECPGREQ